MEGSHSDHRLKSRIGGDKSLLKKIKKMEKDLEDKEREVNLSKQDLLKLNDELIAEKMKSEASANILARKTKAMTEQNLVLQERLEKYEERKALEIQGYKSDIKLLSNKISQLESKMLAVNNANLREIENSKILEQLRKDLKNVEKRKPREWKD